MNIQQADIIKKIFFKKKDLNISKTVSVLLTECQASGHFNPLFCLLLPFY